MTLRALFTLSLESWVFFPYFIHLWLSSILNVYVQIVLLEWRLPDMLVWYKASRDLSFKILLRIFRLLIWVKLMIEALFLTIFSWYWILRSHILLMMLVLMKPTCLNWGWSLFGNKDSMIPWIKKLLILNSLTWSTHNSIFTWARFLIWNWFLSFLNNSLLLFVFVYRAQRWLRRLTTIW